jgi:hypothetical protein
VVREEPAILERNAARVDLIAVIDLDLSVSPAEWPARFEPCWRTNSKNSAKVCALYWSSAGDSLRTKRVRDGIV